MRAVPGRSRTGKGTEGIDAPRYSPSAVAFLDLCVALVAGMFMIAAPSPAHAQSPTPTRTPVVGCCFCKNCPITVNPFCTDSTGDVACADQCLPLGCEIAFSHSDTCAGGCAGMAPYSSPTPTPTSVLTVTNTPTITLTPQATGTPTQTPTPFFCCQCPQPACGPPENCANGCSLVKNAVCVGGLVGQCFTLTPTLTPASTNTPRPTVTPTPKVGDVPFVLDDYKCFRAKSSKASASKGESVQIEDEFGAKTEMKIIKPFLLCDPVVREGDGAIRLRESLACYRTKDLQRFTRGKVSIRNVGLDEAPLDIELIKGDFLCVPSQKLNDYRIVTSTATPRPTTATAATVTPTA